MIIIGYQGVGKSTLAGNSNYIDLESGNFWVNGKREENWHIIYANIAKHLSQQNFNVFMSSHKVVRDEILKCSEMKLLIYPSLELKEEWIKRLQDRYNKTQKDKDYKALMNAKEMYEENITDLMKEKGFIHLKINTIPYNLKSLMHEVRKNAIAI